MELVEVGNDVYACLQEDTGLGKSNSGLVNRAGGLVVDTFWDLPHTREMIDQYARVWPAPAGRVVNTHRNGDHCWGNQLFPGAEIIGHRLCAEEFEKESPAMMEALRQAGVEEDSDMAKMAASLQEFDFNGIELTPPTTLVDDRLDLDLDGETVSLLYVGPAHTQGDMLVHLPERGVLFAGDILFRLCTPVGWEGTTERWVAALDRIIHLAPEVIVPGHGPLCGLEGPREMKAYLQYVRTEARPFYDREMPVLEACKRIELGPYADWTEPERLIFNVSRAYREFEGVAFDTPLDPVALFGDMASLGRHLAKA